MLFQIFHWEKLTTLVKIPAIVCWHIGPFLETWLLQKAFHWALAEIQVLKVWKFTIVMFICDCESIRRFGDGKNGKITFQIFGLWHYIFVIKHFIAIVVSKKCTKLGVSKHIQSVLVSRLSSCAVGLSCFYLLLTELKCKKVTVM